MIDTSSLMAMNSDSFIIFACEKAESVIHTAVPLGTTRSVPAGTCLRNDDSGEVENHTARVGVDPFAA